MSEQITKEMTIEAIFTHFPQKSQRLASEITNAGLSCVGCQAATWETLEAGMLGHGYGEEEIEALVKRLNEVLAEKVEATTISITKRAAEKFLKVCEAEGKAGFFLRFGDKPGGCGGFEYILDFSKEQEPHDVVYESHGVKILVNEKMVERLLGSEIDYLDGLSGSGFKISNPNVKSSCSCGSSQSY